MMQRDGGPVVCVHASAVVVGEIGILIRGAAGAGKTALALALVAAGFRAGRFSRLVADDTVALQAFGSRLLARPHPRTAGMVERRGTGIVPVEHEPACVIRLVADFAAPAGKAGAPRLPEPKELRATVMDVVLPKLTLLPNVSACDNVDRVFEHCRMFRPGS